MTVGLPLHSLLQCIVPVSLHLSPAQWSLFHLAQTLMVHSYGQKAAGAFGGAAPSKS